MSGTSDVRPPGHDGDFLYLTDTAYLALSDHESESGRKWPSKSRDRQDGLFLERLESFIEGQVRDMESFANREQRPLDEIRRLVAIPHARYIFSLDPILPQSDDTSQGSARNIPSIRNTLARLSNTLQMLHSTSGLDSLLLVVSPHSRAPSAAMSADSESSHRSPVPYDSHQASYIGGTDLGKEFWMGLKGGGVNGARAFRVKCQMQREAEAQSLELDISFPRIASTRTHSDHTRTSNPEEVPLMKMKSADVKTELYAAVRHALRSASGEPSAEMRWTKPASLEELYNVRLIGWPPAVEMRNPSNNSLKENRLLLDLVRSGKMKFVLKGSPEWDASSTTTQHVTPSSATEETVRWHTGSVVSASENHPSASSLPSVADSTSLVDLVEVNQRSLESSSLHTPVSLTFPSSSTPGMNEDIINLPNSNPMVYSQSSLTSFPTSNPTAPKRPTHDSITKEWATRDETEAKRAKLDPGGSAG